MPDDLAAEIASGLQPERTSLSWSRTLVVFSALIGVLGLHAVIAGEPWVMRIVPFALSGVALVTAPYLVRRRLLMIHDHLEAGESVAPTRELLHLSILVSLTALLALAIIVL